MTFVIVLEAGEDGYIVAECPALPGCVSQGTTRDEALANIRDAIRGILKVRQQHGLPIPATEIVAVEVPARWRPFRSSRAGKPAMPLPGRALRMISIPAAT